MTFELISLLCIFVSIEVVLNQNGIFYGWEMEISGIIIRSTLCSIQHRRKNQDRKLEIAVDLGS